MCLIVLAWRAHPDYPLIVAANRDEFHGRPAAPAGFWREQPDILAGRDLKARGTWMGAARSGRFCAVTNYRGAHEPSAPHSRGSLVSGFLNERVSPGEYFGTIDAASYSGFNLLAADHGELGWMSNRDGAPRALPPGVYGLGNALLDDPGVDGAKARFRQALEHGVAVDSLFAVLAESKIVNPQYGTRCTTILLRSGSELRYAERSFSPDGAEADTRQFVFGL